MSIVDQTLGLIKQGREGEKAKLLMNIPKLDEHLYGIKQGYTYLIGGDTGSGKSNLVNSIFIDNVYEQVLAVGDNSKLDALFVNFSLEIPAPLNMAATLTRKIFADYQKVLPVSKLFSWSSTLSAEEYALVESYEEYLTGLQSRLLVVDRETTPEVFHDTLMRVAKSVGSFSSEAANIDDCGTFTPTNPNLHVIILFDTLNLASVNVTHPTLKLAIDKISKIGLRFRNKCNFIIVEVQQYNSEVATTDRARFGVQGPNLKDFMDSTSPTKDATVVLGLYLPSRYMRDDQTVWRGYDVAILKNWLVSIHILKNRYGQAQKYAALKFDGAVGIFTELPPAIQMTTQDYENAIKH